MTGHRIMALGVRPFPSKRLPTRRWSAARFLCGALLPGLFLVLAGCSGSESSGGEGSGRSVEGQAGAGEEPASLEVELPDEELGEIERANLDLALRWTTGAITGGTQPDQTPARTVASVTYSQVAEVDRMTITFEEAGPLPSYELESSIRPLPYCAGADSVRSEGPGLLRVQLSDVVADSASLGEPLQRPELGNVSAVHLTCIESTETEWVLDVARATFYRVIHASDPTRLVVDVRQTAGPIP